MKSTSTLFHAHTLIILFPCHSTFVETVLQTQHSWILVRSFHFLCCWRQIRDITIRGILLQAQYRVVIHPNWLEQFWCCQSKQQHPKWHIHAWELSAKMQISMAVKLTFHGEKKICLRGKEIGGTNKKRIKKGSTSFSSALNTHET